MVEIGDIFMAEFAIALRNNRTNQQLTLGCTIRTAALTDALRYNEARRVLIFYQEQYLNDDDIILLFKVLEYNTTILYYCARCGTCSFTNTAIQSLIESLEYNDTFRDLVCHNPIFEPIWLRLNSERNRTAPKKGLRLRQAIYSMMYETWIYL